MASKRHLRRKACEGKRRHPSVREAQHAVQVLYQRHVVDGEVQAYQCPFCGGYHVGHARHGGKGASWGIMGRSSLLT